MTLHLFDKVSSIAQPLSHGGAHFSSVAEIVRPPIFSPVIAIGTLVQIEELLATPFMAHAGIYMAIRLPLTPFEPVSIRVGEGQNVAQRLEGLFDDWVASGHTLMITLTCEHKAFEKTCAEMCEHRITALIEATRSADVQRDKPPKVRRAIPELQRAIDDFVLAFRSELELRRIFLLTQQPTSAALPLQSSGQAKRMSTPGIHVPGGAAAAAEPVRTMALCYGDLSGLLDEMPDHVVIRAGTEVSRHEVAALQTATREARRSLIRDGIIGPHPTRPDRMILRRDHEVGSLTAASRLCTGSTQSGTHTWRPVARHLS